MDRGDLASPVGPELEEVQVTAYFHGRVRGRLERSEKSPDTNLKANQPH